MSICIEYSRKKPIKVEGLTREEARSLTDFHYAMGASEIWVSKDGVCYVSTIDFPGAI
jgi:hypothetical protein